MRSIFVPMRKLLTYCCLALYLNTAVFIPVTGGEKYDTINSAVEFVVQKMLGCKDLTPDDEEEENSPVNSASQISFAVYLPSAPIHFEKQPEYRYYSISYPPFTAQRLSKLTLDIVTPPPDMA